MLPGERAPNRPSPPRMVAMDGLRGIAALSILVLHCWLYTTTAAEKTDSVTDGVIHQLRLGVPLFFCLSGFLLYRGWVRAALDDRSAPALGAYLRRRFWRIAPAYWLCLIVTVIVLTPLREVRGVNVPDAALLPLFFVFAHNLHPATSGALDPPMWTLAVEVQFYLLLPVLGAVALLLSRAARARVPARLALLLPPVLFVVASVLFNAWLRTQPGSIVAMNSLIVAAPAFACGMIAAVLVHGRSLSTVAVWACGAVGVALVIADGLWHETNAGPAGELWRDLPAAIGFALLVVASARARGGPLATRPALWLGSISYGIYLWHMPVMLTERGLGVFPEHQPLLSMLAVAAVTIPIAWLSWIWVERPLLRFAHRPQPDAMSSAKRLPDLSSSTIAVGAVEGEPALNGG